MSLLDNEYLEPEEIILEDMLVPITPCLGDDGLTNLHSMMLATAKKDIQV